MKQVENSSRTSVAPAKCQKEHKVEKIPDKKDDAKEKIIKQEKQETTEKKEA